MAKDPIETDYFIVGAGATGMAFADTLLTETDARIVLVDRHDRPGGHWNDAYPFVRLHQPAAWYGVASRELGSTSKDTIGLNAGLYRLASGAEVLAHFDEVMQQRFLPSGRVRWFPMSEYRPGPGGAHMVRSLTSGELRRIFVRRKLVDATHARTQVPATHAPKYAVDPDVSCVPINGLPRIQRPHARYTVVGSGKTGIDACLWLLEKGVAPDKIRWIMPRDAWFLDRKNFQPGLENFERNMAYAIDQFEAIAQASSVADLFRRLDARGALLRIDSRIEPTTYRCATVTQDELAQLGRIQDIVRMGHLRQVAPTRIVLDTGSLPADCDTLYVDCSAGAIQPPPRGLPVFDEDRINLLMVTRCQPVFSAALIAFVECHVTDCAQKNALCTVVPSPEQPIDWLYMWAATLANSAKWRQHPGLHAWLMQCRLNGNAVMMRDVRPDDTARKALAKESGVQAQMAMERLPALLATMPQGEAVMA